MVQRDEPAAQAEIKPHLMNIEPILAVRDVFAATDYYKKVLDFEDVWLWGDPPDHGGAHRDGVGIQFSLNPALVEASEGRAIWMRVQDVGALYARHQERGAEIIGELEPKPWGMREYTVRDLNGYRLRFAEPAGAQQTSRALPPSVRIEARPPTWLEMEALIYRLGWEPFTNFETAPNVLKTAHFGAVAVVEDQVVGCALLTGDSAGFYYVRDVMVHPDWQRQSIGTALMQALMDYLHAHAPARALVGLYTGANLHDFYARFGFRGPNNGLYGMTQVIR